MFVLNARLMRPYVHPLNVADFKDVPAAKFWSFMFASFELHDTKTGATVWSSNYARDEPVKEKDVSAVVAAMDRNVHCGLDEIAAGLQQ